MAQLVDNYKEIGPYCGDFMDEHLELWALMLSLAGTMLLTDALKNLLSGLSSFGPLACFLIGLGLLYAAMRIKKKNTVKKRGRATRARRSRSRR